MVIAFVRRGGRGGRGCWIVHNLSTLNQNLSLEIYGLFGAEWQRVVRLQALPFCAMIELMNRQEILERLRENEAALRARRRARGAVRLARAGRQPPGQRYRHHG